MNTKIPIITKPVRLTELAAKMIFEAMDEENYKNHALRVGVLGGGCAGLRYNLDFTEKPFNDKLNEIIYKDRGIEIVIDCFSASFLIGVEIDYNDGLNNSGFKFNNVNELQRTCGCGSSFGMV